MKDRLKLLGGFVVMVCTLLVGINNVSAVMVESSDDLEEAFEGKNVSISGKTITLSGDIQDGEDLYDFMGDNYILDLNGYKLVLGEMYVDDGSLTINDSKGNGHIDARSIWVSEEAKLIINNGKFQTDRQDEDYVPDFDKDGNEYQKKIMIDVDTQIVNTGNLLINNGEVEGIVQNGRVEDDIIYPADTKVTGGTLAMIENVGTLVIDNGNINLISNEGDSTINNGTIMSIWNLGNIVIEDGDFVNILQEGSAKIKGGTFTAKRITEVIDGETYYQNYYSQFNIDADTEITGGEFKTTNLDYVLMLVTYGDYIGDPNGVSKLMGDGYLPIYTIYDSSESDIMYRTFKVVRDETTLDELMNKLAPNGILTVDSAKPKSDIALDSLLTSIVNDRGIPEGYEVYVGNWDGDFSPENGAIYISKVTGESIRKQVKVVYNEPEKEVITNMNPILNKISERTGEESDIETSFVLEDLYLINYLKTSKEESFNYSLALNFAKDLIELTNGSNISYKFDYRKGDSGTDLWSFLGGQAVVYYNGIAIDTTEIGLTSSNVIYIPNDTLDTDEAKIQAALKRVEEYLGTTDGVTIEVGGLLESLGNDEYDWNEYNLIDEDTCGTKYYNVTINDKTYKFAICKKEKLETPVYITSDIASNISVKSNSSDLPLDTAITVKEVVSDDIEKVLGTKLYAAYDISLYSSASEANITKLENGKFIVSIPVPEKLKNKEITVYYINSKGEKEEHVATVKDGVASFETDHFSTYVLTEKIDEENPNTGDNIIKYIVISIISLIGLITLLCLKKKYN